MGRTLLMLVLAASSASAAATFNEQIAPIVFRACAPCHRPGEPAPFSLLTYADVRKRGEQIVSVITRRYMPPWLPEPAHGDFVDERRLTNEEIHVITEWVRAGAPQGPPAEAPEPPAFTPGWQLGKPDLVLEAASAYHLRPDGPDEYWNFILPLNLPAPQWVKAIEIRPGNLRAVHHANVLVDRTRSARAQEKSPGAGFPGMDLSIESDTFDPDSHFLFWKPGGAPWIEPDGMAWQAAPGTDLVLNVHMQPTGKAEEIQPSIGLYFTGQPATKFPMLLQLERDGALDIPAGDANFAVADDFVLPLDVNVLAIYPHAHYLGHVLEAYATLPDKTRSWLIRIPDWDPNWQSVYRYREPVFLPKGTTVSMRYSYDNSAANPRNPNHPPQRVHGGDRATDEMAHLWLQVLPRGEGDRRMELQEAIMRHRLDNYPGEFTSQFNLGALMMARGDRASAEAYLRGAIAARPEHPVALNALGALLLDSGKTGEASALFARALAANPRYTNARFNLASAEALQQQWEEAAAAFREVLAESPGDEAARRHLGEVLRLWGDQSAGAGKLAEAATHLRDSLAYRTDDAALHSDLGVVLARMGRFREAVPEFEAALRLDPKFETARRNLAAARAHLER